MQRNRRPVAAFGRPVRIAAGVPMGPGDVRELGHKIGRRWSRKGIVTGLSSIAMVLVYRGYLTVGDVPGPCSW
jgi:hypothetical protein